MEIVGRGRGSWLRAATGSREVGEEEVDEESSVAVPEKGTELGWDAEEPDDEGPGTLGLTSSAVLTAGLSSFAFPFGSAIVVVAVGGLDGGGEDGGTLRTGDEDSPGCASSYPGSWSGAALASSLVFRRPYRVHRL